jgi:hypothetical protein
LTGSRTLGFVGVGAESDFTSIARAVEEWAGVEIRG